ncbi:MAG: type IV secretory system conjugative DNA transfer family protein, partial [Limisphaerales bacterium]
GFENSWSIARELASSLRVFANPNGNELIPLTNDDYPYYDHIEDVLRRQSRRAGMLLTSDELIGFVHLPSSAVRSAALERNQGKTKAAPEIVCNTTGLLLGNNVHLGETIPVRITPEQRVYHSHIIGATGTGKSTLLFNLIKQDIESGAGVAVLDPHGDLIDRILSIIPPERIDDVVLVDPSDEEYSIGFNILSAHSEHEKTLLASDLVSVFQRLSTSWGDQMQSVLQNAILAFLNSDRRGTLSDLRRFLIEPQFRAEFLKSVSDPNVLYYWHKGFSHLSGNKSIGPILTRLEMFLAQKPIAYMVSQPTNRLDFGNIMDSGKIFLAKLPEGLLGRENSYLLGTLLVSKFHQLAMARQAKNIAARRDYWIYADEFANFITPSMAEILSGARKYRIGLTLAHHELHQLQRSPEVASAVMTHPFTRVVFRVSDDDAKKLADGFSFFEANDLKNLETGQAIARVQRSSFDFNLSVIPPDQVDEADVAKRRQEVITGSRKKYGTPRAEVEAMLRQAWEIERSIPRPRKENFPSAPNAPTSGLGLLTSPPIKVSEAKPAELPQTTVLEKSEDMAVEIKQVPNPKRQTIAIPSVKRESPRDLGRGGAQHQAIQQRIKQAAEEFGFRAVIEKSVLDGQGSVDLWLERTSQTIACEISITNTIDYEVGNIMKCIRAGVPKVVMICLNEERLRKIATAISGSLGSETAARVEFFQPDQFIAYMKTLPMEKPKEFVEVRRGYKIKRVLSEHAIEQQKDKEVIAIRAIADSMRKS